MAGKKKAKKVAKKKTAKTAKQTGGFAQDAGIGYSKAQQVSKSKPKKGGA